MSQHVAVVGAGITGRLMALRLTLAGHKVTLWDERSPDDRQSCSFAAAGMLTPVAEAAHAEPLIAQWGCRSIKLWPALLETLSTRVPFHVRGSLALTRQTDLSETRELAALALRRMPDARIKELAPEEVELLEPSLAGQGLAGLLLEGDGQIDNHALMDCLAIDLPKRGVTWRYNERVETITPHHIVTSNSRRTFDWIFDCRGIGAGADLKGLRGVRGEAIVVHAPEVSLARPIRMLDHRYPLYIVPRGAQTFVLGATALESASRAPISLTSALEILNAAYAFHSGFHFASITSLVADARPAFFDNRPRVISQPGLTRINGLYRHGYLLGPLVTEVALGTLAGAPIDDDLLPMTEEAP